MVVTDLIITVASIITALGIILGAVFSGYRWYLKQNKQDEDIKEIKQEQVILIHGILACLKGLKEQGCDGPVTSAITEIEVHLNKRAHK
jgi:hypothetical protein